MTAPDAEYGAVLEVGARAAVDGWREWDALAESERAEWRALVERVLAAVAAAPLDGSGAGS